MSEQVKQKGDAIEVGDKVILPFSYGGKDYPDTEWTVRKVNRCSYRVTATINPGLPNYQYFGLYLIKKTWTIAQ